MKKILLLAIVLTAVFCVYATAFAMTDSEKQALIAQIQAQITQLTAQLNQMMAEQGAQVTQTWCHTFNTNLGFANTGTDEVSQLHAALQKEGISYASDAYNAYTENTATAVVQLQAKHGITQTGYVGARTRAKLNTLYGCQLPVESPPPTTCTPEARICPDGSYVSRIEPNCEFAQCPITTIAECATAKDCSINDIEVSSCTPNWSCTNWSACCTGSACTSVQTKRTCTDLNNCGTLENKPSTIHSCPQIVTFEPRTANATVPENLFWMVYNATSCTASGAWSGEKNASYGTYGIGLVGEIQGVYTLTCKDDIGATTSRSVTAPLSGQALADATATINNSSATGACASKWMALNPRYGWTTTWYSDSFSICITNDPSNRFAIGQQSQTIKDNNNCLSLGTITQGQTCNVGCTPKWMCSNWSTCSNGQQARDCRNLKECGITSGGPNEFQSCTPTCSPNWICGIWGACSNGQKTRTCIDTNKCGITSGGPETTKSCSAACVPNWQHSMWSYCATGQQTANWIDHNYCNDLTDKPYGFQFCFPSCTPDWICSSWSACVNGQHTRTCIDVNDCKIPTGNPHKTSSSC